MTRWARFIEWCQRPSKIKIRTFNPKNIMLIQLSILIIDAQRGVAVSAAIGLAPEQYPPEIGIFMYQVYLVRVMAPGQDVSAQTLAGVIELTITYHFVDPLLGTPGLPYGWEEMVLADEGTHLCPGGFNGILDDIV